MSPACLVDWLVVLVVRLSCHCLCHIYDRSKAYSLIPGILDNSMLVYHHNRQLMILTASHGSVHLISARESESATRPGPVGVSYWQPVHTGRVGGSMQGGYGDRRDGRALLPATIVHLFLPLPPRLVLVRSLH